VERYNKMQIAGAG